MSVAVKDAEQLVLVQLKQVLLNSQRKVYGFDLYIVQQGIYQHSRDFKNCEG